MYKTKNLWVIWVSLVVLTSLFWDRPQNQLRASLPLTIAEPGYCDPAVFDEGEFSLGTFEETEKLGLVRAHAFHLGSVTLVGAGVGNSKASALESLALKEARSASGHPSHPSHPSQGLESFKYCTWYFNHPKSEQDKLRQAAARSFNQKDIDKSPVVLAEDQAGQEFMKVLSETFDQEKNNFLKCAQEQHYIAMGCNEMMHRGPSVFGMLLAFSGCSPEHSLEITDQVWGLNGVRRKVRLAIIRQAFLLGESHPDSRKKFKELFSTLDSTRPR